MKLNFIIHSLKIQSMFNKVNHKTRHPLPLSTSMSLSLLLYPSYILIFVRSTLQQLLMPKHPIQTYTCTVFVLLWRYWCDCCCRCCCRRSVVTLEKILPNKFVRRWQNSLRVAVGWFQLLWVIVFAVAFTSISSNVIRVCPIRHNSRKCEYWYTNKEIPR